MGDGRLRNKKGTRDFRGGQTSKQAKRERNPPVAGKHWMTGREYETQKVVANVIVESGVKIRNDHFLPLKLAPDFLVLAFQQLVSAEVVNRTMLRCSHEPGARVIRDT